MFLCCSCCSLFPQQMHLKTLWLRGNYIRFLTSLQKTAFWKHGDQRRNCSKQAISAFVTMFSNSSIMILSFNGSFQICLGMFSKLSAADLLHSVSKGLSKPLLPQCFQLFLLIILSLIVICHFMPQWFQKSSGADLFYMGNG